MLSHYIGQFTAIHDGEPWFGESFVDKLQDVSEEQAFRKPHTGMHSIASLLHHCIFWRQPLLHFLRGNTSFKATMKDEGNWLSDEKLKTKGWVAIQQEFHDSQSELIRLLKQAPSSFLEQPYRNGETMHHLVEGVLQHDIYHLGQIGMTKSWINQ